jgi:hypothetical protein
LIDFLKFENGVQNSHACVPLSFGKERIPVKSSTVQLRTQADLVWHYFSRG